MKFCPECATPIRSETVNFCENCGYAIPKELGRVTDSFAEQEVGSSKNTVYTLGVRLEQMVEQIFRNKGFETFLRQKLKGKSGAIHEIDILAKRDGKVIAIECKNFGESRTIGIKEIRDFHSKLLDLPEVTDSMFVTNISFSSGVQDYASHHNIQLWNGEKLQHDFYLLNLGRLEGKEEALIGNSLPVTMNYEEASKVSLVNPMAVETRGQLIFRPYYLFEYELDMKRGFLGKQRIRESSEIVMDAVYKKILQNNSSKSSLTIYERGYPTYSSCRCLSED